MIWNVIFVLTLSGLCNSAHVSSKSVALTSTDGLTSTNGVSTTSYSSTKEAGDLCLQCAEKGATAAVAALSSQRQTQTQTIQAVSAPVQLPVPPPPPVFLPYRPPVRFGFDGPVPTPPGPYHTPNCGCVPRGACGGEVGLYTRHVILDSDLVCGLRFETCCYDGPWPGVADEFARAAACVPQEQCVRPYGILPTDVRDFGIIAPCPGYGAVRCIIVDSAELLEFKANLAAIEASAPVIITPQPAPIVPIVPPPVVAVQPAVTYAKANTGSYVHNFAPIRTEVAVPAIPTVSVPTPVVQAANEAHSEAVSVVRPAAPITPLHETPAVLPPAPLLHPRPAGLFGLPGFGLGAGLGFRKHFSISKGFGWGFGK